MQNIKESKSLIQPPYVITRKLNIEAFLKDKNISEDINIKINLVRRVTQKGNHLLFMR